MSTRGDIIRGAGGLLKRNTDLGVGIGHPHGGEEGDIRVQMVDSSPKLYARAGSQWYSVDLAQADVSEDLIIGTNKDHFEIKADSGIISLVNDYNTVAEFGQINYIGQQAFEHIKLTGSSMEMKDGSTVMMSLADGDINLKGKINVTSTGSQNVMMGVWSATDPDVASNDDNICLGTEAGRSLANATNNVLIGTNAGYTGGAIGSSIAIGKDVMKMAGTPPTSGSNDMPIQNVAIGDQSMALGGWSKYNVAIGKNSLKGVDKDSRAEFNVAIGNDALLGANGTAANVCRRNVAVGADALKTATTGHYNVCVGYGAGDTIEDGNNNTCIGYLSDGAADQDDQIAIGRTAVTSASDSICIGTGITNSTTRTVKFGDSGNSMISLDWDTGGDSTWVRSSDIRKKRNINDSTLGLEFINKLRPVTYQWKPQNELPKEWENYSETNRYDLDKVHIGFIAQEVKALLDEYNAPTEVAGWVEDPDGMQRLGETKLITPLIKAVQELSAKVDTILKEG